MTLRDFFSRWCAHAALAALVWVLFALCIERVLPGFAAPFVDLPALGLFTIGLLVCAIASHAEESESTSSRTGRLVVGALLLCVLAYLWTQVGEFGKMGMSLIAAACVLAALLLAAIHHPYD